ncbi:peptide ABC transporter ATP-binding protein [Candidatus Thiomargarita nelsonii]|uniref:ABC-type dipeptide transporter n=1 Tax=Candidatus Thiomargarita nelsonii TaxID=1003181 RepID=A0A0A6PAM3_9GAMM|nr:peptide ABC transporter ATP-binding protein [Candidatus Thiomargarita nelsonii]
MKVLEIANLHVSFFTEQGELGVVQNVAFDINAGETVALVGESGCGKSVTALAIMALLEHSGRITQGSIKLKGQELVGLPQAEYQKIRGRRIGMIFQEPMTSLNPVFTIGKQIGEVLTHHFKLTEQKVRKKVLELLEQVGISEPHQRINQYPHELSGGMKQRVMIAMALACEPDLLIADEPTTALDVTIQAQILQLLKELQNKMGMSILLITHNLGVVANFAQRVVVMYAGQIAEHTDVRPLFKNPLHPYTQALLKALPIPGHKHLYAIKGTVPLPQEYPAGCRFCSRCSEVMARCPEESPRLKEQEERHQVACWLY